MLFLMISHQNSGTGGFRQRAGLDKSPLWVGMTNVPSSVRMAINAWITATAPPHTHPNALSELWTSNVIPE
jgi:hypothetical protein